MRRGVCLASPPELGSPDGILGPLYREGETEALPEQVTSPSVPFNQFWQILSSAQPAPRYSWGEVGFASLS